MLYKVNFNHQFFYLICNIFKNKTIFISALDWGLGHATRCVPLIRQLMEHNVVILGVTKTTAFIFSEEFPQLTKVEIEPYNITYSSNFPLSLKLILNAPRIAAVIKKERQQLKRLIKEHHIDVVISDNRFGLSSKEVECIYITHQLQVKAGTLSRMADKIHHHYIKQFNSVWVPDYEKENDCLAGLLSRSKELENVRYIGPLSRLPHNSDVSERFDYLCLLSGPEPLRTDLESLLIEKANNTHKKICFVRGTKQHLATRTNANVCLVDMPDALKLSQLIRGANTVICRSGYSTLMDLHHLNQKNCILIPTPGQGEQVYLANYWAHKFGAEVMLQKELKAFTF
ncbi:MAG: glycosyltransferase [Bacteroidetes bacterium]|nr:glycosyltransferase [Bacteroidota bacterium]